MNLITLFILWLTSPTNVWEWIWITPLAVSEPCGHCPRRRSQDENWGRGVGISLSVRIVGWGNLALKWLRVRVTPYTDRFILWLEWLLTAFPGFFCDSLCVKGVWRVREGCDITCVGMAAQSNFSILLLSTRIIPFLFISLLIDWWFPPPTLIIIPRVPHTPPWRYPPPFPFLHAISLMHSNAPLAYFIAVLCVPVL